MNVQLSIFARRDANQETQGSPLEEYALHSLHLPVSSSLLLVISHCGSEHQLLHICSNHPAARPDPSGPLCLSNAAF